MATSNTLVLTWSKASESAPWLTTFELEGGQVVECTVGTGGKVPAGARLQEMLWYMEKQIEVYPIAYDLRQIDNREGRTLSVQFLADKPVFMDAGEYFVQTNLTYFKPDYRVNASEQLDVSGDYGVVKPTLHRTPDNPLSTVEISSGFDKDSASATNTLEFVNGDNRYWVVFDSVTVTAKRGDGFYGFIEGFVWPNNEAVPKSIGHQDLLSMQATINVDYLSVSSFGVTEKANKDKATFYGCSPVDLIYAEAEATNYNHELIHGHGMVAVSVQYSTNDGTMLSSDNGRILGTAYATDYQTLGELETAVASGHFKGININKALLKEKYSQSDNLKYKNPAMKDIPLVEYTGNTAGDTSAGLKTGTWAQDLNLQQPPTQPLGANTKVTSGQKDNEEIEEEALIKAIDKIAETGKRSFAMSKGFVNNDLCFVPALDDRIESGELYHVMPPKSTGDVAKDLPYDYVHRVRLGDMMFEVPPLSIRVDKQFQNQKVQGMRSKTAMQSQVGHTRNVLTMELYFHDLENINGRKVYAYTKGAKGKNQPAIKVRPNVKLNKREVTVVNTHRMPEGVQLQKVTVNEVVDGDTFRYIRPIDGEVIDVRMVLIDTPEKHITQPELQPDPCAYEATEFMRNLIEGKNVYLEVDTTNTDAYDRELRYVYLEDGTSVQGEILKAGFARLYPFEPDTKYAEILGSIEFQARKTFKNIWSYENYVSASGFNQYTAVKRKSNEDDRIKQYEAPALANNETDDGENIYYYMDGLRTLIAQFKKTPFLPIDNDYINSTLKINNVALRNVTAQTVEGFPEAVHVTLSLEEVDIKAYLMGEESLGDVINYPLMRWYYQQLLHESLTPEPWRTYLPTIDHLDNNFTFGIVEEKALKAKTQALHEFRYMRTPASFKSDQTDTDKTEEAKTNQDALNVQEALAAYDKFLDVYQKGYDKDNIYIKNNLKSLYPEPRFTPIVIGKPMVLNSYVGNFISSGMDKDDVNIGTNIAKVIYGKDDYDATISREAPFAGFNKPANGFYTLNSTYNGKANGGSAVTDKTTEIVTNENLPGYIQVVIEDKKNLQDIDAKLKKINKSDSVNNYKPSKSDVGQQILTLPASTTYITMLKDLEVKAKALNAAIDAYTFKYNALAAEINKSESDLPMTDVHIRNLIPMNMQVSLTNNFSIVQVQQLETPAMQFFGASEPEVFLTFETDESGVNTIEWMLRKVADYAKTYRDGIVSGFMDIRNPLLNLFGIRSVLPDTIQYNTVPNHPGRYTVSLSLLGFDKAQRRQEALYGYTGGSPNKELRDMAYDKYDPRVDSLYIEEKMRQMELYPDLEMPKVSELNEALKDISAGLDKWQNYTDQVYLDPDFYVSTTETYRKYIKDIVDDGRDIVFEWRDGDGYVAKSNLTTGEPLIMDKKTQEMFDEDFEKSAYYDPTTVWDKYGEGSLEDLLKGQETKSEEEQKASGITPIKTELKEIKNATLKKYLEGKNYEKKISYQEWRQMAGQNATEKQYKKATAEPSDADVWFYLAQSVLTNFYDIHIPQGEAYTIKNRSGAPTEQFKNATKRYLDPYLADPLAKHTWGTPRDYYWEMYRGYTEIIKVNKNKLENGIEDQLRSGTDNDGLIAEITGAIGGTRQATPFMRIMTQLKSIIKVSSGGKQFDGNKPFVSAKNKQKLPARVGIMGIDVTQAKTPQHVQRLMWDWQYNIDVSVREMALTYNRATRNNYHEIAIRALDWAVASHSGEAMPKIIETGKKEDDKPIGDSNSPLAPESYQFYTQVLNAWNTEARQSTAEVAPAIYTSPKGGIIREVFAMYNSPVAKDGQSVDDVVDDMIAKQAVAISDNLENWTTEEKVKNMFIDMYQYDHTGRLLRAFPSFSLQLIDEGKWYGNFRTWDNFYGYSSLNSIDVYKSRKIAADTAIIQMSNMYSGLSGMRNDEVTSELTLPSFFSSHYWEHYVLGTPTDEVLEERRQIYESIMLEPGARVHLRMGYGADARHLPIVFNGVITEVGTGEVVQITAQSDGLELTNQIAGSPEDENKELFQIIEPSEYIGKLMTTKGNWFKNFINAKNDGKYFKESALGIAHFGSSVVAESGNYNPFSNEFGESVQNVYSQNGQMVKQQWMNQKGDKINLVEASSETGKININLERLNLKGENDEDNIAVKIYGATPWEIIQTFALCSTDYIAAVFPFEMRSSLFFGKPNWPVTYRYDSTYVYDGTTKKIRRNIDYTHKKTFMQAHIYSSEYNIITNKVTASEEGVFNNVVVTFDGRTVGPMQADSDIRYDRQRTAVVEANIVSRNKIQGGELATFWGPEAQAQRYGHACVRDFMKDMYKGSYIVLGDGTVKPYDMCYMSDTLMDMQGIHLVKAVHHSMNANEGFLTHIEPDAYVVNFDVELLFMPDKVFEIAKSVNMQAVGHSLIFAASAIAPPFVFKLANVLANTTEAKIGALAKKFPGTAENLAKLGAGLQKRIVSGTYAAYGKAINSERIVRGADILKAAETSEDYQTLLTSLKNYRKLDTDAIMALKKTGWRGQFNAEVAKKLASGTLSADDISMLKEALSLEMDDAKIIAEMSDYFNDIDKMEDLLDIAKTVESTGDVKSAYLSVKAMKVASSAKKVAMASKALLTFAPVWAIIVDVGLEVLVSSLMEMWQRKKQDAQCVIVMPLKYKGKNWTAGMNGHRGSVKGDDPSLSDKLMHAQFGQEDSEVEKVVWNFIPKTINFFEQLFGK